MHDKIDATAGKDSGAILKQINSRESEVTQRQGMEGTLTNRAAAVLQRMVGNRGVGQVLQAMQGSGNVNGRSSFSSNITIQRAAKSNNTGLPDQLKSGIENMSGYSMDDVKVHYNSSRPQELNAHAYAQGNEIHLAPGQEQHLPHEAWHVVQQRQGRVQPTMQLKGVEVNDNEALEKEATELGNRAMEFGDQAMQLRSATTATGLAMGSPSMPVAQLMLVRIRTERRENTRYISSVDFEGRALTSAKGGKGDHTVADFLPKLMFEQRLIGLTHINASQSITSLLDLISEDINIYYMEDGHRVPLSLDSLQDEIHAYQQKANDPATEGEDLNAALEDVLDGYIRLWNKRTGAAYTKDDWKTKGGGGAPESEAKDRLELLGEAAREMNGNDDEFVMKSAAILINSIDFILTKGTIEEASSHISMALELMLRTYPELEQQNGSDIMYGLVGAYAKKVGLDEVQEEQLLRHCYNNYYGDDFDDYDDYKDNVEMEEEEKRN